jgi:hypothetical protein
MEPSYDAKAYSSDGDWRDLGIVTSVRSQGAVALVGSSLLLRQSNQRTPCTEVICTSWLKQNSLFMICAKVDGLKMPTSMP